MVFFMPPSPPSSVTEDAYEIIPGDPAAGLVILADHATNRIPAEYDALGLPAEQLGRHIAYDIGIAWMTRRLAALTGAPAVLSRFSRLLIDPNRGDDDPTLVMRLSDGAIVPGNARIGPEEREARIARFWRPYDEAIGRTVEASLASGTVPTILSLHSFTPVWRGRPRPWHCGVLWDRDPRLPHLLLAALGEDPALVVGDNEPYSGILKGDTMYRHATRRGLAHAILEVRQDLIADQADAEAWAARVARIWDGLAGRAELHRIERHGSWSGPVE
ncbi:N-formylglutamate amidohydrolase [Prosthecomicrobium sp. N25]|uniref:N-formylglutamate amidohydrolase n=1 Tax=Prosthecomicrobium sp. N25 TaxID=3129254 RepID=UPI00307784ED